MGDSRPAQSPSPTVLRFVRWLWRRWQRLYVSHRGLYSLERLHMLHDYSTTHSIARCILACLLTPLPTLLFVVGLELIPLKPPEAGWRANDTTWLRLWLFSIVVTYCLLFQAREMVTGLPLSAMQTAVVSVISSTGYCALFMLASALWRFPIPFGGVLGVLPFTLCLFLTLAAVVGPTKLREINRLGKPMAVYAKMIAAQCSLAFVYPAYNAIFTLLGPTEQIFFFVLLPLIKLTMKNVVARISEDMEDLVPELALFTVELFNALYMVTCMQNAGSTVTTLAVILLDATSSFLALRDIHHATSIVHELQRLHLDVHRRDLLALVQQICLDHGYTKHTSGSLTPFVRLRTVARHRLQRTNSDLMRTFEVAVKAAQAKTERSQRSRRQSLVLPAELPSARKLSRVRSMPDVNTVVPLHQPLKRAPSVASALSREQQAQLVEQTLRMLFRAEYLVLTEYIECAMPLVYAAYLAVLFQLPNVRFFAHTRGMSHAKLLATLSTILTYAALETLSLLALHAILWRRFRLSALHQLAFVLETQRGLIQGKMLVWAPFIFQFTLLHCGNDFTFRFNLRSA